MDYAAQHLKHLFQLTLFTMSVTKRSISHYNLTVGLTDDEKPRWMQSVTLSELRRDEAKLGRVLQSVRSILTAANDVLDPDVVSRVEGVCNYLGEISVEQKADGKMEFPKYDVCRVKVTYLIELLQTYSRETRSFKDTVDEPYGTSPIDSEADLAEEVIDAPSHSIEVLPLWKKGETFHLEVIAGALEVRRWQVYDHR